MAQYEPTSVPFDVAVDTDPDGTTVVMPLTWCFEEQRRPPGAGWLILLACLVYPARCVARPGLLQNHRWRLPQPVPSFAAVPPDSPQVCDTVMAADSCASAYQLPAT